MPAPWLRRGRNEVVVFEVEGDAGARSLQGLADPVYATDPDGLKPAKR